jgi:hypothetical protein
MKNKLIFISIGIVSLLTITYLRFNSKFFDRMVESKKCEHRLEANNLTFSGRITSKYTDDRTFRWIEIYQNGEIEKVDIFVSEVNNAFEKVMTGDSLIKEKGTLNLRVVRNNDEFSIILDYGCPSSATSLITH